MIVSNSSNSLEKLLNTRCTRERAGRLLELAKQGKLPNFSFSEEGLERAVDATVSCIEKEYPSWDIPFHSRWRHFDCSSVSRVNFLKETFSGDELGRVSIELALISVLLDAGSGGSWSYYDSKSKNTYEKSEGLAIASWNAYISGIFSQDLKNPYQVDGKLLENISSEEIGKIFQVTKENPLSGLEERASLLRALGSQILAHPEVFSKEGRLGDLFSFFKKGFSGSLKASEILGTLLNLLNPIWPLGRKWKGINIGDVGEHSSLKTDDDTSCLIPFHKLTQWLTYSLLEPLQEGGIEITDLEELTPLPEYRNGGLLIDSGALILKDLSNSSKLLDPQSELIVEWRGLTVALIDEIAVKIRKKKGLSAKELPLASILQGGTWLAGRVLAKEKRLDGSPPLNIRLNGTIF
jgi:hypothetical protein